MYDTLCLNTILSRADLFGQFFCQTREGKPVEGLYYQLPWLFDPVCVVVTGRDTGKSLVLTIRAAHHKVQFPGSSELGTSVDESRVKERFEEVFTHFIVHPLLREWFVEREGTTGVTRSPRFRFRSINRHILHGVIPGLLGNNYRQYHTDSLWIEEAALSVHDDMLALRGTQNVDNPATKEFWCGVPDGRLNSPFWEACHDSPRFKGHVYNVAKWSKPAYTITELSKDLEWCGRRSDTNEFLQEVRGLTGDPRATEFVPQDVRTCMDSGWMSAKYYGRLIITHKMWENAGDPAPLLSRLPHIPSSEYDDIWQAFDIGRASKTIGGTFAKKDNRWHLIHILDVRGIQKIEAQQDIIESYRMHFGASKVGIDVTEGAGASISQNLSKVAPVIGINFSANIEVPTSDGLRKFRVYEWGIKEIADMLARKEWGLPNDRSLFEEFTNFTVKKRGQFHTIAMFIVFTIIKYLESSFISPTVMELGAAAIPSSFGDTISIGGPPLGS